MNYMEKVAEMLGVELNEVFYLRCEHDGQIRKNIDGEPKEFRITELEVETRIADSTEWGFALIKIADILRGEYEIQKLPYEPKHGDMYWNCAVGHDRLKGVCYGDYWTGDTFDLLNKYTGNCFKTKKEAKENWTKVYERINGKKWEEDSE